MNARECYGRTCDMRVGERSQESEGTWEQVEVVTRTGCVGVGRVMGVAGGRYSKSIKQHLNDFKF